MSYPILETQMRLIAALQHRSIEALEAGDWQAAARRCAHLNSLCEGLHYLTQILDGGNIPEVVTQRSGNRGLGSIRSAAPTQPLDPVNKRVTSPPPVETTPNPMQYAWAGKPLRVKQKPIDEVW